MSRGLAIGRELRWPLVRIWLVCTAGGVIADILVAGIAFIAAWQAEGCPGIGDALRNSDCTPDNHAGLVAAIVVAAIGIVVAAVILRGLVGLLLGSASSRFGGWAKAIAAAAFVVVPVGVVAATARFLPYSLTFALLLPVCGLVIAWLLVLRARPVGETAGPGSAAGRLTPR